MTTRPKRSPARNRIIAALTLVMLVAGAIPVDAKHGGENDFSGSGFFRLDQVRSQGGVVATESALASAIAVDFLDKGGNVIDAMVAAMYAIAVTHPTGCGLGGGGFMLYRGADGTSKVLDFRETAPAALNANTFNLGPADGSAGAGTSLPRPGLHLKGTGHRTVGVPGFVAGMDVAHEKLGSGRFTMSELIEPAEELARNGFQVSFGLQAFTALMASHLANYPETTRVFGPLAALGTAGTNQVDDRSRGTFGKPVGAQDHDPRFWINLDLAISLGQIMDHGPEAFYTVTEYPAPLGLPGKQRSIGALIVSDMENASNAAQTNPVLIAASGGAPDDVGLLTADDLAAYEPVWRKPLRGEYLGREVLTMPPPSAGGIAVLEILNLLEALRAQGTIVDWSPYSIEHLHFALEAQKVAWADRNQYGADDDFVKVPTRMLISQEYADERALEIGQNAKTLDEYGWGRRPTSQDGMSTTHLSFMDAEGNAAAVTCSLNTPFGSAVTPAGTGIVLNNHILDFDFTYDDDAAAPANGIEPGKRPRSSMSPTIVVEDRVPLLVTGGAGGISTPMGVVHNILGTLDWGFDIWHAIDAPRFDAIAESIWAGSAAATCSDPALEVVLELSRPALRRHIAALEGRGHVVCRNATKEYVLPVMFSVGTDLTTGEHVGAADPRSIDRGVDAQGWTPPRLLS